MGLRAASTYFSSTADVQSVIHSCASASSTPSKETTNSPSLPRIAKLSPLGTSGSAGFASLVILRRSNRPHREVLSSFLKYCTLKPTLEK